MTPREAIQALMRNPFYYRLTLAARKALLKEFLSRYAECKVKEGNGDGDGYGYGNGDGNGNGDGDG